MEHSRLFPCSSKMDIAGWILIHPANGIGRRDHLYRSLIIPKILRIFDYRDIYRDVRNANSQISLQTLTRKQLKESLEKLLGIWC